MSLSLKFPLPEQSTLGFLKSKTDLYSRFLDSDAEKEYDFINFCYEKIWDDAQIIQWLEFPFSYYDGIDVCIINVCEYQGIFFVIPGPEHEPKGYFFNREEAVNAAEQHISELYDESAYEEYYASQKANGEEPKDEWNF